MSVNPSSVDCECVEACFLRALSVDPQAIELVAESGPTEPYRGEPIRADSEHIQVVGEYRARLVCPLTNQPPAALPDCRCCLFQTRA